MEKVKIGNYVKQIRGVSYKPNDLHNDLNSDSVILLRANNINEGKINFDDIVYIDKSKVKKEQYLKKGDILVCASSGSKELVGKAAFINKDYAVTFGAFCKLIRPKDCIAGYLGHYFNSQMYKEKISSIALGANINNIRNEHIDELLIYLPNKAEQQNISILLDEVSDLTDKRKKQLSKLDEFVKSRFIELFGGIHDSKMYPYKMVKELTEVISGGTPSRDVSEYWEEGTIPWVKTTELHNNVVTKVEEYITEKGLNNSSAKIVPVGTVLVAMYGQGKTRGMTAYLEIKACTNQACACILPSDKINQKFLWYFFILSYDNLRDLAKGGNQPNLNGNMIKTYPILYPPIELQNQFAAFVKQVDKSKFEIKQSLKMLELLKKALMQKYFG